MWSARALTAQPGQEGRHHELGFVFRETVNARPEIDAGQRDAARAHVGDGARPIEKPGSPVQGKLGLPSSTLNFDIKNGCLGFLTALDVAGSLIDLGRIGSALIVAGEISRGIVDATIARLLLPTSTLAQYRAQFVSLTLGSAACAVVLTRADAGLPACHRLVRSFNVAAAEHHACASARPSR